MLTLKVDLMNRDQFKKIFFSAKDQKGIFGKRVAALSRFGAYVMTDARRSVRKRKKISEPGDAPSSHVGLLRSFIHFGKSEGNRSVVIGPAAINGRKMKGTPRLLEYGGSRRQMLYSSKKVMTKRIKGKRRRSYIKRTRIGMGTANYRARPFMRPAFKRTLDQHSTTDWLKSVL